MKKLLLAIIPIVMLLGCNINKTSSLASSGDTTSEEGDTSLEGKSIKIDYTNDGGANIPETYSDGDTGETVRKATYSIDGKDFAVEFVGKWRVSTKNKEFQTVKEPVSYVRSASNYIVKKVTIEVFKADIGVFKTLDHTGDKVSGTKTTALEEDGEANEYTLNTHRWSFLGEETYRGSNINIYSFTFYF